MIHRIISIRLYEIHETHIYAHIQVYKIAQEKESIYHTTNT